MYGQTNGMSDQWTVPQVAKYSGKYFCHIFGFLLAQYMSGSRSGPCTAQLPDAVSTSGPILAHTQKIIIAVSQVSHTECEDDAYQLIHTPHLVFLTPGIP